MELATIGAIADNGVRRLALSKEDGQARAKVISWARELGMTCDTDPIGNLFLRYSPADSGSLLPPLATGSHLDTEPNGGRFDGTYGVLAGLEAIEALKQSGHIPRRPIEVVIWTNEEGSRFQPAYMGSSAFIDPDRVGHFLAIADKAGVTVGDAMKVASAYYQVDGFRTEATPFNAYVEAHIEQGPVLEETGKQIGNVSSIYGIERFDIDIIGEAAHAGTTPLSMRKDAVVAAVQVIQALSTAFVDDGRIRFTVGKFEVSPGSATVVPESVRFSLDVRHPDQNFLNDVPKVIHATVEKASLPCASKVRSVVSAPSVTFDRALRDDIERITSSLRFSAISIASGAGHDARYLAEHCPSAMIFVPSHKGISHNPAEFTSAKDLGNGARVLTDLIVSLTQ
jgi:N-carbamoyl-L-amino-acid hydrolase